MTTDDPTNRPGSANGDGDDSSPAGRARFRRLVRRVLIVQVVALLALWLLQTRFGSG